MAYTAKEDSGGERSTRAIGVFEVAIAASGTNSDVIPLGQYAWGSFSTPSALTGTTITVQYSNDGTNFTDVPVEGTESNGQTVTTDNTYRLPIWTFAAKFMRLVSGSSEAAARTITVFLRS